MWPPRCIFVNREPRWQQRSNAAAHWAKQHNDDLEIERSVRQEFTVFTLSGHMRAEEVAELKELFDTDYRSIILDLQEMRLADRERSEVPAELREGWDEAGELSGVRPSSGWKGKKIEGASN